MYGVEAVELEEQSGVDNYTLSYLRVSVNLFCLRVTVKIFHIYKQIRELLGDE
jgi:hypothetical protein